jgi:hypothetical protein
LRSDGRGDDALRTGAAIASRPSGRSYMKIRHTPLGNAPHAHYGECTRPGTLRTGIRDAALLHRIHRLQEIA